MKSITRIIYSLGLFFMILSGTVYGISGLSSYEPFFLAISIVLICCSNGKIYFHNHIKTFVAVIFVLFIISIAFSFFAHPERTMIITVVGISLLSFSLFVQIPSLKNSNHSTYENDSNIIMMLLLLIQLYSVLQGFTTYRFAGIYSNSNFTGGEAATLCAVSCAVFLQRFLVKKQNILFPLISILVSIVIVVATNSRTAVGTVAIMLAFTGFFVLRKITDRTLTTKIVGLVIVAVVGMLSLYRVPFVNAAIKEIFLKFLLRKGNELAGRQDRWDIVLNRLSFWGNGENTAIGTHNTFLSMIDQYGYIAGGLLALFVIVGLVYSLKMALINRKADMKYLPFFCFVCFAITSMFEQMLLKNIMLLCLYSVPLLHQLKKIEYEENELI